MLGMPVDLALDPATYGYGARFYRTVNNTSLSIGQYEALKSAAIDPYQALLDAYVQNREEKVKN